MKRNTGSTQRTWFTTRDEKRSHIGRGVWLLVPLSLFALIPFLEAATPATAATAAAPRLPSLSIAGPASIEEGNEGTTNASFTVKLSATSRKVVSVRFRTEGFFATQGADYRAAAGTLVFKRGQRTKNVVVQIIGDTIPEDVEDFYVDLSKPSSARLRVARAAGKIAANDLPPPFSVVADLKAGQGPAFGRAVITLDAPKGEATFTLEVRSSLRDPISAHIHSRSMALGGGYPSLTPVPTRDGVVTGAIQVAPRTILLMDANLADFVVEVHHDRLGTVPEDLSGDLRRP